MYYLSCKRNQIITLVISKQAPYDKIYCDDNQLTHLDVSNLEELRFLDCNRNQLLTLDVSHLPSLEKLYCSDNQIVELDLGKQRKIKLP